MIDVRRYKGLIGVGAGLYCALFALNAVLLAGFGKDPALFDNPDRQLAWSQLERSGAQVAGVELEMRQNGVDDQPEFGVILGQSTTMRGIDPLLLESQGEPSMRWLLINGFGSSFVKLNYYAQTLLASGLRPRVVVMGLHATMLAGQDRANKPGAVPEIEAHKMPEATAKKPGLRRQVKRLVTLHWVRKQRKNISHFTNMGLFEMRLSLHKTLGSGAVGLFQPGDNPWRLAERPQKDSGQRKQQRKGWRNFGWFEPGTYDTGNTHADAFRDLMAGLEAMDVPEVVIVLLPISSDLRDWLPSEADERMSAMIDEVRAGRTVRVFDMRDAMPDEVFFDYVHLTPAGREVFTRKLAEAMNGEAHP